MADLWMDVDVALAEVPVNVMPLIDDTDFKSKEESVVYNQAGLDLVWNFVTSAGAMTQTAVTPTESAGDYDWSNQGNGFYAIEIPASGGASVNNDTEGFGWFSGVATGILPWRGPVIGFRAAALNNALIDGGDELDVNVTQIGGDAQSATDLKDFADAGYDPGTNKVQGVVLADTVTTYTGNTPQTGDSFARLGAPAGASVSADIAAVKVDTAAILADTGTDGVLLTATERNATADAILARALAAESYAADGGTPTLSQMLWMIWAGLVDFSITGTTLTVNKQDGTAAMTFNLDDAVSPTSRTRAT